jgi:DnaJ-class molecular chaperone
MANNMKAGATWNAGITQSAGTYLPGSTSVTPGGGMPAVGGGGGGDRNVSIVVQVPDVTSADAIKFAQMVKQYLDDDSLLSNTGSI